MESGKDFMGPVEVIGKQVWRQTVVSKCPEDDISRAMAFAASAEGLLHYVDNEGQVCYFLIQKPAFVHQFTGIHNMLLSHIYKTPVVSKGDTLVGLKEPITKTIFLHFFIQCTILLFYSSSGGK